jgi:hypothetical protein
MEVPKVVEILLVFCNELRIEALLLGVLVEVVREV